ncbi:hypothetical protein [Spirillospora albida]|uniref:hypothetical protein n=1 Tax=Spirillospora albida TaxID=58123 RepID=UPI000AAC0CA3|nr:hypothetical protein [Spirillospora albida]
MTAAGGGHATADGKRERPPHPTATAVPLAGCAALGGFLFGYDSSVINGPSTRST